MSHFISVFAKCSIHKQKTIQWTSGCFPNSPSGVERWRPTSSLYSWGWIYRLVNVKLFHIDSNMIWPFTTGHVPLKDTQTHTHTHSHPQEFHRHLCVFYRDHVRKIESDGLTCWEQCVFVCLFFPWVKVMRKASTTFISLFFCRPLQVKPGQRTVQTETKYIELMVVNDHDLVWTTHMFA